MNKSNYVTRSGTLVKDAIKNDLIVKVNIKFTKNDYLIFTNYGKS